MCASYIGEYVLFPGSRMEFHSIGQAMDMAHSRPVLYSVLDEVLTPGDMVDCNGTSSGREKDSLKFIFNQ